MLGDLLAKEEPTLQDREAIRLEMNKLQQQVSGLSVLMDSTGNLDPNVFLQHSRGFSLLPHECAAMYKTAAQSIPDNDPTTLTYDASSAATWGKGLEIDPTTGFIYVTGIPRETVLLIVSWGTWAANATGIRDLIWNADDGSVRTDRQNDPIGGLYCFSTLVHMRQVASAQTYYYMEANQNSGDPLDITGYGFAIARLR